MATEHLDYLEPRAPQGHPDRTERVGPRILIVEDHADTADSLERLLRIKGYRTKVAGGVAQALELAETNDFDLLICDLGLPDGDGRTVMSKLGAMQPGLRGIVLSGYAMQADVETSLAAGFSEHLAKPVDFVLLEKTVARLAGEGVRG